MFLCMFLCMFILSFTPLYKSPKLDSIIPDIFQ